MSEHNWIEKAGEQGAEFTGTLAQIKGELGIGDDTVEETLLMLDDEEEIESWSIIPRGETFWSMMKDFYITCLRFMIMMVPVLITATLIFGALISLVHAIFG